MLFYHLVFGGLKEIFITVDAYIFIYFRYVEFIFESKISSFISTTILIISSVNMSSPILLAL